MMKTLHVIIAIVLAWRNILFIVLQTGREVFPHIVASTGRTTRSKARRHICKDKDSVSINIIQLDKKQTIPSREISQGGSNEDAGEVRGR
jgi:hypothetical protein